MNDRPSRAMSLLMFAVASVCSTWGVTGWVSAEPPAVRVQEIGDVTRIVVDGLGIIHETPSRVLNLRVMELQSGRVVFLWDELEQEELKPYYAATVDEDEVSRGRGAEVELKLRFAEFDPVVMGDPVMPAGFEADAASDNYVVQFLTPALPEYRQGLSAAGSSIQRFLANQAYVVRMTGEAAERVSALPYVRWVGRFHPAYKIDPEILEDRFGWVIGEPAERKDGPRGWQGAPPKRMGKPVPPDVFESYNIQVYRRGMVQKNTVAARIREIGGVVEEQIPDGYLLRARLDALQLMALVKHDDVLFIDRAGEPEPDMDVARHLLGMNVVEQETGFTGQGVRGEVCDDNLFEAHRDFQPIPVIFHGNRSGDVTHGTGVYGILFGAGAANPAGRGMLPGAQGIFSDYDFITNRYQHTRDLVNPAGIFKAVLQSNSWGTSRTMQYNNVSSQMDDILFETGLLICQSQSNTGTRSSRPEAWAKNVVSVGGVRHFNNTDWSDDCWCGNASHGPAADGRIKPDLSCFNDGILTTSATNDSAYNPNFTGTSAAAPIVAGVFGIMFQMWHEGLFPGVGGGQSVFDSRPKLTTAKALMVNSARRYDFTSPEGDRGRVRQGWGVPSAAELLASSEGLHISNENIILRNLERLRGKFETAPGQAELRVTMVYMDPPGTPNSTVHRVNDLSLRVESPGGDVYWGNAGLYEGNESTLGGSSNTRDTIENVFITDPEPGVWYIEVYADEVNLDSHAETTEIDCDFALVVHGAELVSCTADWNRDGHVSGSDVGAYLTSYFTDLSRGTTLSDLDFNGIINSADVGAYLTEYFTSITGCP